jgi:hypothetical protein
MEIESPLAIVTGPDDDDASYSRAETGMASRRMARSASLIQTMVPAAGFLVMVPTPLPICSRDSEKYLLCSLLHVVLSGHFPWIAERPVGDEKGGIIYP